MQTAIENSSKTKPRAAAAKKTASKKSSAPTAIAEVKLVSMDLIDTLPQIRTDFTDTEGLEDLAKDIAARGLLQPILLNPIGDRFHLIAGERRLRAVKLNGATNIPALLVKTSSEEALLMQLAENIQREDLLLEDECRVVAMLYESQGSLEKVAATVKKSKAWCSKRYAMTQKGLHYIATQLLENGITEDIELLKSLSSLVNLRGWTAGQEWAKKIQEGKAGRNEVRAALKIAKEADKAERAKAAESTKKISQAKPKEPPPPPPWTIEDAMDDLSEALTYPHAELSALDLLKTWTEEQRGQIAERLNKAAKIGTGENGFKTISNLILDGIYSTPYIDIDLLAMIAGYSGKPFDWGDFLANLQVPREKT